MTVALSTNQYKKRVLVEVALGYSDEAPTAAAVNEVQTVTISGTPTGGTFTLSFQGATTATIAYNAASSAVQSALQALSTIGSGNATVSGSAGGPYTVTFVSGLGGQDVALLTANASALTGGSSPSVGVVETTPGEPASPAIAYAVLNSKGVNIAPDTQELITQGTTAKYKDRTTSAYGITVDQDVYVEALDEIAYTKTGAGASTVYHGTGQMPSTYYELRLKYSMVNIDSGAKKYEYVRFIKCSVTARDPQNSQAEAVSADQVVFEAQQTMTDIVGNAIPGVSAPGDFFIKQPAAA